MLTRIRKWWNGEVREIDDGEPDIIGGAGVIRDTEVVHHWTASFARRLVSFYLSHWKWTWGIAVGLVNILILVMGC